MDRSHDELLGQTLNGTYSLERLLGTGGMGSVYSARRIDNDQRVAIKVLRHELSSDLKQLKRLEREADVASSLRHANIVRAIELSIHPGEIAFMVMEHVEGESLQELLDREERLPPSRVVRIAKQVLNALAEAHAARIVHRDVKPANIMLTVVGGMGDMVKLLDFGIAKMLEGAAATKLTETGATLGTPHYMPPEQVLGGNVDHRVDLYAMGVVLFEALSGQMPLEFDGLRDFIVKLTTEDPRSLAEVAPELPAELVSAIDRALAPSPDDRYQSAAEMAEALIAAPLTKSTPESLAITVQSPPVVVQQPASNAPPRPASLTRISPKLPPIVVALGALVVIVLVLVVGTFVGTALFSSLRSTHMTDTTTDDLGAVPVHQEVRPIPPLPPLVPRKVTGSHPSVPSLPAKADQAVRIGPGRFGPMGCSTGQRVLNGVTIDSLQGPAITANGSCTVTIIDSNLKGTTAIVASGNAVIRAKNCIIAGTEWGINAGDTADIGIDGVILRGIKGAALMTKNAVLRTTERTTIVGEIFLREFARHN